jgi:serine/threonine protein kinase, bacterial
MPGTQTVLPFTGLYHPSGVAVDTADNVYVNDGRVVKLAAGTGTQTVLRFTDLSERVSNDDFGDSDDTGVAVDTAGAVYVADYGNNRLVKLPAA